MAPQEPDQPRRQLTLFDSVCVIVGVIIGAGIYNSTPLVAQQTTGPGWLLLVWLAGGAISAVGALCYAELVSGHPAEGGDFVFLTRAFGRPVGFLFAWTQFWIVRPGSIGAMAYVFATYAAELLPLNVPYLEVWYAAAAILALTLVNLVGVRQGKWTQNLLTVAKVLGLMALFAVAMAAPSASPTEAAPPPDAALDLPLALVFVLFAFGGWNDLSYVGAEMREPTRNVPRALLLGVALVTAIYVLLNVAFLRVLGFAGMRSSDAVAADTMRSVAGEGGAAFVSLLICVTALGAINGMVFTGARIYSAFGKDHAWFAPLGRWSGRFGTPARSLMAQAAVTVGVAVAFGTPLLGAVFTTLDADPGAGFRKMVIFSAPAFWLFILLAGVSLFVLRSRGSGAADRFRTPLYPLTPLLFCLASGYMVYSSLAYAVANRSVEALWSLGLLAVGLVLSPLSPRGKEKRTTRPRERTANER